VFNGQALAEPGERPDLIERRYADRVYYSLCGRTLTRRPRRQQGVPPYALSKAGATGLEPTLYPRDSLNEWAVKALTVWDRTSIGNA
jgi:hypothetical protein